jgi:hypothetical protein
VTRISTTGLVVGAMLMLIAPAVPSVAAPAAESAATDPLQQFSASISALVTRVSPSVQLRTSLAFYRGKVKVFETPVVERTKADAVDRRAAVFQFEVSGGSFRPGLYTCQVNIIDVTASRFAFPRLEMYVR